MSQHQNLLDQRLQEFRKKYYKDRVLRGSLLLVLLISSMLFVALLSEGIFGFSTGVRTSIVFGLGAVFLGVLGYMVIWPLSKLLNLSQTISDFQIADMVRQSFPDINDKLTNLLQLKRRSDTDNDLVHAAIDRKAADVVPVSISSAINFKKNRKYLGLLAIPALFFLITYIANHDLLTGGAERLIKYNQAFTPPPPFQIRMADVPDQLVAGQDFTFELSVDGRELPSELFIFIRDDSEQQGKFIDFNLNTRDNVNFAYTLSDVKENFTFRVGNEEVSTQEYAVEVLKRPFIKQFQVVIDYPAYTGLGREILDQNVGDFKVIKGATATWSLQAQGELAEAWFVAGEKIPFKTDESGETYRNTRRLMQDMEYYISLSSVQQIANIDTVKYRVNILQDRYPSIYVFSNLENFKVDLDPRLPLDLEIADDFGFTRMELHYRFTKSGGTSAVSETFSVHPLSIDKKVLLQPLSYQIDLTELGLREGDEIEYYLKVWDNDGVSGAKATTSATFKVVYPTLDAKYDEVGEQQDAVKDELKKIKEKAESLNQDYKKMQERLLEKRQLSFDDRKEIQRMVEEHKKMLDELESTQEKFEETKEKLEENQMISEQTLEKFEELNKYLEELNNPEIEKLLEELMEKMETLNPEDIREKMEQLKLNDEDLRKSMERTLELLKQLEVQQKIDELTNKLDNLEAKQELLNEKLENAETPEDLENVGERQDDLQEQMENVKEDLEELGEMKEDTKTPDEEQMEELKQDAEEAQEEMKEASEEMKQAGEKQQEGGKKNKKEAGQMKQKASESQQKAKQQLQKMSEQLGNMQMNMQMQQDQQNLEQLRELLENLLKLSFDQEDLRDEVKALKYGDPALKEKSQNQKKLQDDMGLVKDSLESLANKVFQVQKFVLDESKSISENMQKSQTFFRNKQVPMITFHQQSAMTSINNLANMLSEVMKQIQEQMMNAQQGQGMCMKPGQSMQQMSEEQKKLNQQMQQMQQSGQMDGDKLQEMAARQEAIRKQLKDAHDRIKKDGGKTLGDLDKVMQDMKQTETELMNKQLTHETLKRQQEILNRLLQADKSVREQDEDEERESRTAREKDQKSPEELSLEEYKNKIRQELLKSNKLEYSNDFIILIEQYFKKLEEANE